MYIKTAVIGNPIGLYARPAVLVIQRANEFACSLWLEKDERRINAKSLLGVLSLAVQNGETIKIIGDGADETAAVDAIAELISSDAAE
ncbi:MAG: HPr family phosphocarrier protein [Oscillospiraceae bacterium]|jgi:phosphocarrier protein|nr:HPr family phosphocarrier protein [Oscillospiraceae bacterium]